MSTIFKPLLYKALEILDSKQYHNSHIYKNLLSFFHNIVSHSPDAVIKDLIERMPCLSQVAIDFLSSTDLEIFQNALFILDHLV